MMGGNSEYIRFDLAGRKKKTKIWLVYTEESDYAIGEIKWYNPWRKYAFFPDPETIYEQDCMRTIADFLEQETDNRKAERKQEPKDD